MEESTARKSCGLNRVFCCLTHAIKEKGRFPGSRAARDKGEQCKTAPRDHVRGAGEWAVAGKVVVVDAVGETRAMERESHGGRGKRGSLE